VDVVPDAGAVRGGVVPAKHPQELPLAQGNLTGTSQTNSVNTVAAILCAINLWSICGGTSTAQPKCSSQLWS
jgi:hypothetical protein